ncbi:Saccharopine dehydrogenase OS=Lysinibacillus sphaericus OX=1421 GN=LS41612_20775 PE=4 SV=1 [Lysinibacillus sphaericus]
MKVVVLGAGLMGKEVARDLIKNSKVEQVILGDIDVKTAQQFVETLKTDKVEVVELRCK